MQMRQTRRPKASASNLNRCCANASNFRKKLRGFAEADCNKFTVQWLTYNTVSFATGPTPVAATVESEQPTFFLPPFHPPLLQDGAP